MFPKRTHDQRGDMVGLASQLMMAAVDVGVSFGLELNLSKCRVFGGNAEEVAVVVKALRIGRMRQALMYVGTPLGTSAYGDCKLLRKAEEVQFVVHVDTLVTLGPLSMHTKLLPSRASPNVCPSHFARAVPYETLESHVQAA